ncbi:MAG: hypothetical protein K9J76_09880 [Polaromonas sp.]|nr:hypothetical protein [Polaromonas sp.]
MYKLAALPFLALFALALPALAAEPDYRPIRMEIDVAKPAAQVRLAMFSDAACEKPLINNGVPFVVTMDTGQACFSFSYTDPAGLVVPTSHANFRCENEKVVYDKYPSSSDCKQSTTSRAKPTMGYAISNTCQFAASHTGGVYEKLVDYRVPGNADCTVGR